MSYLHRLAQVFAREVGNELTGYTFVFPNRRAGLFFRRYLGQALPQPIFSPRAMTINECFASLSDLRVTDQLTLLMRLYTHYQQLRPEPEPIEQFLHWGKMMLTDFSEIDNHLVSNVEALYEAVKDLHDIDEHFLTLTDTQRNAIKKFWGDFYASTDKNSNTLHHRFIRTWELLYPLYMGLTDSLLHDNLAYEGLLHRQVIEHWADIPADRFETHYVFIGFNALTESERQLLIHLRDRGIADFYFDYEDTYLSDPENRASLFREDNLRTFPSRYEVPERTEKTKQKITLLSVDSTVGEAREVHQVLSELYPKDTPLTTDFTRTAVVLPDEQLLIPLLDCFPKGVKKINVTMGYPLRASELYMPIAYPEKYALPIQEAGDVMIGALREHLGTMRTATNSEAHYLLTKALDMVEGAMAQYPTIVFSAEAVMQILRMMTMQGTIPYTGEPLDGLQVMGVLETRALDFDNLIITGFNDDLYPGRAHNNSFIPYILRRGFGLPTPERQDAIFAYNFYRMLSYAKRVWFITNAVADDQHSGEVSRYFYQLQWQYGVEIEQVNIVNALSTPAPKASEIGKDEAVMQLLAEAQQRGFSASAMNAYLFCQKKFFFRYVQGIHEPQQEEDVTTSEATIGTVLHDIMQKLYEPHIQQVVTESDVQQIIDSLTDERWEKLPIDDIRTDQLALLIVKNYVYNILRYDQKQAPFIYMNGEQKVQAKLQVPNIGFVPFYGYIDRLDKQGNTLRVIDYKTGKALMEYRDMEHIFDRKENQDKALQTMLYCWLLEQDKPQLLRNTAHIAPHIYPVRSMAKADEVQTLVHQKGNTDFVWNEEVKAEFIEGLSTLLRELFDPAVPFMPTAVGKRCEHCAFAALCK